MKYTYTSCVVEWMRGIGSGESFQAHAWLTRACSLKLNHPRSASLSRALVGSLYIKIIIPTYSRRPPLTEKACSVAGEQL